MADLTFVLCRHAIFPPDYTAAGACLDQVESTNGWTALIWAAKRGHKETVARLLRLGANAQLVDHKGMTALAWALQEQHAEAVELLSRNIP